MVNDWMEQVHTSFAGSLECLELLLMNKCTLHVAAMVHQVLSHPDANLKVIA